MTIVANEKNSEKRKNIYFNLIKLINVILVKDVSDIPCIEREYILVKVCINSENLNSFNELAKKYGARIIDLSSNSAIIEASESKDRISILIDKLTPFNIVEIMRTGKMAMQKGLEPKNKEVHNINGQQNLTDNLWATKQLNSYLK